MKTIQLTLNSIEGNNKDNDEEGILRRGIWCDKSGEGPNKRYTVLFCPKCKCQRTHHSGDTINWRCDECGCIHKCDAYGRPIVDK